MTNNKASKHIKQKLKLKHKLQEEIYEPTIIVEGFNAFLSKIDLAGKKLVTE